METKIENPHLLTPSSPINNPAAPQATGVSFLIQLFNGNLPIGYIGLDSSDTYCVFVDDISKAAKFSQYIYAGVSYYMTKGYYLSISSNAYVRLHNWHNACSWTFEDNKLLCDYNKQYLSLYSTDDNANLYAWDANDYTILSVKQV
ncbi:MAG: hypothetical protein QE487_19435 [Fluviicola sp.]|nr:hypothetical protein [Fluviicola sp.]